MILLIILVVYMYCYTYARMTSGQWDSRHTHTHAPTNTLTQLLWYVKYVPDALKEIGVKKCVQNRSSGGFIHS